MQTNKQTCISLRKQISIYAQRQSSEEAKHFHILFVWKLYSLNKEPVLMLLTVSLTRALRTLVKS